MNDTLYGMQMEALPAEKRPESCIGCGACAAVCPQQIDIPAVMSEFSEMLANGPNWAELCRQREEAAERLRARWQKSNICSFAALLLMIMMPDPIDVNRKTEMPSDRKASLFVLTGIRCCDGPPLTGDALLILNPHRN